MGYSENSCQICAVSFNIARLRTKQEPPESGWGYSHGLYYAGDPSSTLCTLYPEQSGCESEYDDVPELEGVHLPGRWCTYDGGFNGWKISVEEMKKPTNRDVEEEEQEDYERASDFFITSQTTEVPDDFVPGALAKIRFGIDTLYAQNYGLLEHRDENPVGVPVHDACWKIFERVSRSSLGEVDLQGFMALWHRQACGTCGFAGIKQDPLIQQCKEQFWMHLPGTEYFGANPHDIPGLMLHLHNFFMTAPAGESVFREVSPPRENKTDTFRLLPAELKTMIRSDLSSQDIVSLRLVSRAFRYLPKKLFLELIEKEMPWFWEFDDLEAFMARVRVDHHHFNGGKETGTNPFNWYVLYKQLCLAKRKLLGLRNRVRIWNVAEEIAERIKHLRDGLGGGEVLSLLPTEKEKEQQDRIKQCGFSCFKCDRTLGPLRF
ncbi:hypothetical protein IFR05_002709 [Cadophora sp. M221]|nr:hypothetical protein IFR05_002709 [Cadophora sp. M221]